MYAKFIDFQKWATFDSYLSEIESSIKENIAWILNFQWKIFKQILGIVLEL